jgi:hypothetical protein
MQQTEFSLRQDLDEALIKIENLERELQTSQLTARQA